MLVKDRVDQSGSQNAIRWSYGEHMTALHVTFLQFGWERRPEVYLVISDIRGLTSEQKHEDIDVGRLEFNSCVNEFVERMQFGLD